ncbi:MAG: ABC transporter permease [Pseudomonadota bacterium]
MTAVDVSTGAKPKPVRKARSGRTLPMLAVLAVLMVVWYIGAIILNSDRAERQLNRGGDDWGIVDLIVEDLTMDRPVLPAPHQVAVELWNSLIGQPIDSPRSLVFHASVTMTSTLVGFVLGTVLGMLLAIGIVHVRTLDRSLMPWVIASQTIPILAIAPMIVVVLGNIGFTGVGPKSVISAYLCFFPVTIGMVKGLRSPDPMQLDLMRTYSATTGQTLAKLRWPASIPFLFPSLRIGISLALVGAIVGELPTGAQAGIGARLLLGSYYGQMTALWAALLVAAFLAIASITVVGLVERLVVRTRGGHA